MEINDVVNGLLSYGLPVGFVGSIVSWIAGRRTRQADVIQKMQESIENLGAKYAELSDDYASVVEENAHLKNDNSELLANQQMFNKKIDSLNAKVDELTTMLQTYRQKNSKTGYKHDSTIVGDTHAVSSKPLQCVHKPRSNLGHSSCGDKVKVDKDSDDDATFKSPH